MSAFISPATPGRSPFDRSLHRRGHDGLDALGGGEVGGNGEHAGTRLLPDLVRRTLEIGVGPGADRDPGALAREREGRRPAETLARRGHERNLAVQP
jgi:hypothetical protein